MFMSRNPPHQLLQHPPVAQGVDEDLTAEVEVVGEEDLQLKLAFQPSK